MKSTLFARPHAVLLPTLLLFSVALVARAQQPPPPPEAPAATPPPTTSDESSSAKKSTKFPHADWFLIHGTVFDDKSLSLPGAQLRIKRQGEKKFRWNTYTNSRGEFAIRVPPGSQYEVAVQAQGFVNLTQSVDAKNGLGDENVTLHMARPERKK